MRFRSLPPNRTWHLVIAVLGSALVASGFSKLILGELFGAGHTVQVITWFATFALCLAIDFTNAPDDAR